jgi:glucokinase
VLVGIDVGGTKILGGLVDLDGTLIMQQRRPTRPAALLADISDTAHALVAEARARGLAPHGIGVGIKGLVEHHSGRLVQSINLGVTDLPIKQRLVDEVALPIAVDNDVHAATLGELKFGIGRRFPDFVLYNAGTGLAVGMVFNHRLYRGANNYAGESGHIGIDQSGASICACGMSGCVEWLTIEARKGHLHVPVLLPKLQEPPPSPEYVFVALNLIHIVNLLNPPAIALAGGMFTANPTAADWVRVAVRRHILPPANEGLRCLPIAHAGAACGLVGAAALLLESAGDSAKPDPATEAWP